VVAGSEIIAQRSTSQLLPKVSAGDILGADAVKIDSEQVADLAREYALANGSTLGALDYELRKNGADAAPLWTVTCRDDAGRPLGQLVVTAGKGRVVSHEGFANEPIAGTANPIADSANTNPMTEPAEEDAAATTKTAKTSTETKKRPDTAHRIGGHLQKFFTGRNTLGK
jgi:hypothetical protein